MSPTFQLTLKTGPQPGKIYPLTKGEMIVGRDAAADVIIPDAEVSRKHARLYLQGGSYVLEDLGSTNGSFVDGQRLMGPHALRAGEMIMFGENISLTFEAVNLDPDKTVVGAPLSFDQITTATPEPLAPEPVYSIPTPEPAPSYSIPTPEPAPSYSIPTPEPAPSYSAPSYGIPSNIPSGTLPETPVGSTPPAKKNNTRTWIIAGCGCLTILFCGCGGVGWWVSQNMEWISQMLGI